VIGDEEYLWAIVDGHVSRYMALASAGHGQYVGVAREQQKCTLTCLIAECDAGMLANKYAIHLTKLLQLVDTETYFAMKKWTRNWTLIISR
jgi:hypothetical protein